MEKHGRPQLRTDSIFTENSLPVHSGALKTARNMHTLPSSTHIVNKYVCCLLVYFLLIVKIVVVYLLSTDICTKCM